MDYKDTLVFQSMIESVLAKLLGVCFFACIDNPLIFSETEEEHNIQLLAVKNLDKA